MKPYHPLLAAAAVLALSGCFSFGPDTPDVLLTITSEADLQPQASRTTSIENAVTVVTPTVPEALQVTRIPVQSSDTTLAYLQDAQWVDTPAEMFRRLLSDTISARTGRAVLDPLQFTFDPGNRLTGQLQVFGVDARTNEAVVTYDAALARGATELVTRRFEARVPVAAIDRASVAPALNQAANRVAVEVSDWIGN